MKKPTSSRQYLPIAFRLNDISNVVAPYVTTAKEEDPEHLQLARSLRAIPLPYKIDRFPWIDTRLWLPDYLFFLARYRHVYADFD